LANQAAEDEAEANTEAFNTLYKNIANEHKAVESGKPLKRHTELIYTYQMDNDLKADSLEIKQLLSAAGISSKTYASYVEEQEVEAMKPEADENYQPLKTKKASAFLAGLKGQILWKLRSTATEEQWQKSVENLMDKENLSVSEVLWVSQQLGFI
jgi:predicted secreted protein